MAPREINEEEDLNENMGHTSFGTGTTSQGAWFNPTGRLGRWFSRFFASKAQPYVAQQGSPGPTPMHPLGGDTVQNQQVITAGGFTKSLAQMPVLPEQETVRRNRYREYEMMDEYPEVGSSFDIYADDSTQLDTKHRRWRVKHDNPLIVDEVEKLFKTVKMDRYIWDIVRNTVKYGDCFIETILDMNSPKIGIQRIKILNPLYIFRVENEYGFLTDFLQEIPMKNDWGAYGGQGTTYSDTNYITLDKNQITHFRLHTSDPVYYPYGKSIASLAVRIFRSLRLMEDAMLIYRLQRAPERRIFYVDVGTMPSSKADQFIEKVKQKFKKEKFYNNRTHSIDERYNPISVDEDFYVPVRGQQSQTKIETLPGAQNLGDVDDVKYFRDKLLAALKVPKDYIVEKDQSPERKANLSQLDVKFARVILRVQHAVEIGLETIAKRHLLLKGMPSSMLGDLKIELPSPSDMFEKRLLDLQEQRSRVAQAVLGTGLFSKNKIYKDFYDLTDNEIEEMKKELKEDMEEMQQQQMDAGGMGMGGAMGGDPMMEPSMQNPAEFATPGYGEAGGQEGAENKPPTESIDTLVKYYEKAIIAEGYESSKARALNRIINKLKNPEEIKKD
jgi:hypothetical protein